MIRRFLPKKDRFFVLFNEISDLLVEGAVEFRKMLDDMPHVDTYVKNIKDIEHKADSITHEVIDMLRKTFITPLEREDIRGLIGDLDDVIDWLDAAAQRFVLFEIKTVTPEIKKLSDVCIKSTEQVRKVVRQLDNLKHPATIIRDCVEINRLENEGDQLLRTGIGQLFHDEQDLRQLIKLKEIYEKLEQVTDCCEDVANRVEGIIIENA